MRFEDMRRSVRVYNCLVRGDATHTKQNQDDGVSAAYVQPLLPHTRSRPGHGRSHKCWLDTNLVFSLSPTTRSGRVDVRARPVLAFLPKHATCVYNRGTIALFGQITTDSWGFSTEISTLHHVLFLLPMFGSRPDRSSR